MSAAYLMPSWNSTSSVPLLDVDFTTFTMGFQDATAFQANTFTAPVKANLVLRRFYNPASGLNYDGSRGETVQTSPTTLLRSALSVQTDVALIGNRTSTTSKRGLVIQHSVAQQASGSSSAGNDGVRNLGRPRCCCLG